MKSKFVSLDFEFSGVTKPHLSLICCSLKYSDKGVVEEHWLSNSESGEEALFISLERAKNNGYILLAHMVVAEARALLSMSHVPEIFDWIDKNFPIKILGMIFREALPIQHQASNAPNILFPGQNNHQDP